MSYVRQALLVANSSNLEQISLIVQTLNDICRFYPETAFDFRYTQISYMLNDFTINQIFTS